MIAAAKCAEPEPVELVKSWNVDGGGGGFEFKSERLATGCLKTLYLFKGND
jgi:hypothetical protein